MDATWRAVPMSTPTQAPTSGAVAAPQAVYPNRPIRLVASYTPGAAWT